MKIIDSLQVNRNGQTKNHILRIYFNFLNEIILIKFHIIVRLIRASIKSNCKDPI